MCSVGMSSPPEHGNTVESLLPKMDERKLFKKLKKKSGVDEANAVGATLFALFKSVNISFRVR